jgi:hypothetical protein
MSEINTASIMVVRAGITLMVLASILFLYLRNKSGTHNE